MESQELLKLLKKNLKIKVFHPEREVGFFSTYIEEDTENVTVQVFFGDQLICEDSSQFH